MSLIKPYDIIQDGNIGKNRTDISVNRASFNAHSVNSVNCHGTNLVQDTLTVNQSANIIGDLNVATISHSGGITVNNTMSVPRMAMVGYDGPVEIHGGQQFVQVGDDGSYMGDITNGTVNYLLGINRDESGNVGIGLSGDVGISGTLDVATISHNTLSISSNEVNVEDYFSIDKISYGVTANTSGLVFSSDFTSVQNPGRAYDLNPSSYLFFEMAQVGQSITYTYSYSFVPSGFSLLSPWDDVTQHLLGFEIRGSNDAFSGENVLLYTGGVVEGSNDWLVETFNTTQSFNSYKLLLTNTDEVDVGWINEFHIIEKRNGSKLTLKELECNSPLYPVSLSGDLSVSGTVNSGHYGNVICSGVSTNGDITGVNASFNSLISGISTLPLVNGSTYFIGSTNSSYVRSRGSVEIEGSSSDLHIANYFGPFAYCRDIDCSDDGNVAVASDFSTGLIYTTTDKYVNYVSSSAAPGNEIAVAVSSLGNRFFVINYGGGNPLYRSNDGVSWVSSNTVLTGNGFYGMDCSGDGSIVYTSAYNNNLLYKSVDGGINFSSSSVPGFLDVVCSNDGSIVSGVRHTSVYVSKTSGATWTSFNYSAPEGGDTLAMSRDGKVILTAPYVSKPYISTDYGDTWVSVNGLPEYYWYSAAINEDGGKILLAARIPGQSPEQAVLYMSSDSGNTWEEKPELVPFQTANSISMVASSSFDTVFLGSNAPIAILTGGKSSITFNEGGYINCSSNTIILSSNTFVVECPATFNTGISAPYVPHYFTQTYNSATWYSVNHNLNNSYPQVTVWEDDTVVVPNSINRINADTLVVDFNGDTVDCTITVIG